MGQMISFSDGEAYERSMGVWSRLAGDRFMDFLDAGPGLSWLDVGCGNGASTEVILTRGAPSFVHGVDPAEGQLAFARSRHDPSRVSYDVGRAESLPYEEASFDVVIMALVIFFTSDPAKSVQEMARVTLPGGLVATYVWDMLDGGFPFDAVQTAIRRLGYNPPLPPSSEASRASALERLWRDAGLRDIERRTITVQRTYADFDDFWTTTTLVASIRPLLAKMAAEKAAELKELLRSGLSQGADGAITITARANAIKGRKPE